MNRITITLPDDLARWVREEAHRRSTRVSEIIRMAIAERRVSTGGRRELGFAAICHDPAGPMAARLDDELARSG